ncbi:MAG: hypothetical protein PVJ72_15090, partial [Gammaproteobacteria bacterium]
PRKEAVDRCFLVDSNIKRGLVILGEKNVISKSYASSGLVSVLFLLGFMIRLHLKMSLYCSMPVPYC